MSACLLLPLLRSVACALCWSWPAPGRGQLQPADHAVVQDLQAALAVRR